MKFFQELKRRNMFRVAGAYAVVGWLLVQMIVAVKGPLRLPVWTDTFVILLILAGFPIALILAWAFELTPDGVRPTRSVDPAESITAQTGRKLDFAIVGGLALVAMLIVAAWAFPGKPQAAIVRAATDKSIAVLPFDNRSSAADDAYFAEGIHDDLLTQLSKVSALRVISRTSMTQYAGSKKPIPEIAKELGVAVVLEGAVQRAGDRVRINVQLIDGASDEHIWADTYDRQMSVENIFEIQSDITATIADALQAVMTHDEKAAVSAVPTHSIPAYEAFLRGKTIFSADQRDPVHLEAAIEAFDMAISLDPEFADAYARKAIAQLSLVWWGFDSKKNLALAEGALNRAKELAPDSVETKIAHAVYLYDGLNDFSASRDAILPLLQEAPNNADIWYQAGLSERRAGDMQASIHHLEGAVHLNPVDPNYLTTLANTYSVVGEWRKANDLIAKAKRLARDSLYVITVEAQIASDTGDMDAMWKLYEAERSAGRIDPQTLDSTYLLFMGSFLSSRERCKIAEERIAALGNDDHALLSGLTMVRAEILQQLGREDEARRIIEDVLSRLERMDLAPTDMDDQWFLLMYTSALLGEREETVDMARTILTFQEDDKMLLSQVGRDVASMYMFVGEADLSFELVRTLMDTYSPAMFGLVVMDNNFDDAREDPRYLALKARYNAWRKSQGLN